MGNWYAKHPGQDADAEGLHIGKHSGGWEFLFRAHPDFGLTSTTSWRQFLDHPWVTIVAEHGVTVTASEFWEYVAKWSTDRVRSQPIRDVAGVSADYWTTRQWRDVEGFPFAAYEFC
jgi:hypothetical protein